MFLARAFFELKCWMCFIYRPVYRRNMFWTVLTACYLISFHLIPRLTSRCCESLACLILHTWLQGMHWNPRFSGSHSSYKRSVFCFLKLCESTISYLQRSSVSLSSPYHCSLLSSNTTIGPNAQLLSISIILYILMLSFEVWEVDLDAHISQLLKGITPSRQ